MARTTNPVITGEDMDGKIIHVKFIDGKRYKLQHPGNRVKMRWEKEVFNPTTGIDIEKFMDLAFEHCVIPEGHGDKPSIDTVKPKDLEVWQRLLRRFLDGDLEAAVGGAAEGAEPGRSVPGSKNKD